MNDFERFLHAAPKEIADADAELGELLRAAGPRPPVPAEDFDAIERAARAEWRTLVRSRSAARRRRGAALALAAGLVLALAVGWWWRRQASPVVAIPVATVARAEGVTRTAAGAVLAAGASLPAGAEIETGARDSRLALRLEGGQSVRLDVGTRLRVAASDRLELEAGALYFDSADTGGIRIATAFGTVRDIGTRFEVRIEEAAGRGLVVRVRQGEIVLERQGVSRAAAQGEELRVERDGTVTIAQVAPFGDEWAWAQAVAPTFEIDGRPLGNYLEWVERETGLTVVFADPELESLAAGVILGGTIEGLTVDQSLRMVLAGSGLDHRVEEGRLLISTAAGG